MGISTVVIKVMSLVGARCSDQLGVQVRYLSTLFFFSIAVIGNVTYFSLLSVLNSVTY